MSDNDRGKRPLPTQSILDEQYDPGARVNAVATAGGGPANEQALILAESPVILDKTKAHAEKPLVELAELSITLKIATENNARVAAKVYSELGLG